MGSLQEYIVMCIHYYRAFYNCNPKIIMGKITLKDLTDYNKLFHNIKVDEKNIGCLKTLSGCDIEINNAFDYGFYLI